MDRKLLTIFFDFAGEFIKFLDHNHGFVHAGEQVIEVLFFKLKRFGILPRFFGGHPLIPQFPGNGSHFGAVRIHGFEGSPRPVSF